MIRLSACFDLEKEIAPVGPLTAVKMWLLLPRCLWAQRMIGV